MNDLHQKTSHTSFDYRYRPAVRRSVISADDQGNFFVYAITDAGLRVGRIGSLDLTPGDGGVHRSGRPLNLRNGFQFSPRNSLSPKAP